MDSKQQIRTILESAQKIAMFGHRNPDGDCVGSLLGLGRLLTNQGKSVSYFAPTQVSNYYAFVADISQVKTEFDYQDYDVILFVDFSDSSRIQEFWTGHEDYFAQKQIIVIDHHMSKNLETQRLRECDPDSMSACEVIFELTYPRWPQHYDETVVNCLYMGLTTDSGNFSYDVDHERILKNALKLVQLGANKKSIINHVIRRKSFQSVKMIERLLSRLVQKGEFVYSRYIQQDLADLNISSDEADFGQIIIQDINEAKVTCIFREQNGAFHGSLRSKNFDVEHIAQIFGGGGHMYAAGFKTPRVGDFAIQLEQISDQINAML